MPALTQRMTLLERFYEAVRFLTVFRVPTPSLLPENALARSMIFFPLVGFLIGIMSLVLFKISEDLLPARVSCLVLLIAPIFISGGLHLDGFADFCDGFFGGRNKSDVLRIMKDSSVGAWGALGLALLMLTKFELLLVLPNRPAAFLLAMTASRWTQVIFSFALPYAGSGGGVSERVARKITSREVFSATAFLIVPLFLTGIKAFYILAGVVLILFFLGMYFKKRIGGVTGDLLGAASELTEIGVLLLASGGLQHHA